MEFDPNRRRACPSVFQFHNRMMFYPSRFSSSFQSSEGLAPFVALDQGFARPFQPTSFSRGFEMGGAEGASSLPGS